MSTASMARFALLSLALWPASAYPQATPEPDSAPEPDAVAAPGDDAVSADPAPDPSEEPLDDYEASEQISEDLSVSFPVDI